MKDILIESNVLYLSTPFELNNSLKNKNKDFVGKWKNSNQINFDVNVKYDLKNMFFFKTSMYCIETR